MKRDFLILLALLLCTIGTTAWGACPGDSVDTGICDSLYIEPWSDDVADSVWQRPGPYFIRVPIYYTHDLDAPNDSVSAIVLPLCYWHTNSTKYCSVSVYWNKILFNTASIPRNIFRHLPTNDNPLVHNRIMDIYESDVGAAWGSIILDVSSDSSKFGADSVIVPAHFWLTAIPSDQPRWWEGSRVLFTTITFKLQDTMQVCLDTCLWPPSSRIAFSRVDTRTFIPVLATPHSTSYKVCFFSGPSDVKEIEGSTEIRPSEFSLSQNYPNPFNPVTNFQFSVFKSGHVRIELFNIVGQKIKVLVDEDMKPGVYVADWNGKDENGKQVSSGIYFYRMQAGEFSDMKKMVLIK